jgi:hypothetical protein
MKMLLVGAWIYFTYFMGTMPPELQGFVVWGEKWHSLVLETTDDLVKSSMENNKQANRVFYASIILYRININYYNVFEYIMIANTRYWPVWSWNKKNTKTTLNYGPQVCLIMLWDKYMILGDEMKTLLLVCFFFIFIIEKPKITISLYLEVTLIYICWTELLVTFFVAQIQFCPKNAYFRKNLA